MTAVKWLVNLVKYVMYLFIVLITLVFIDCMMNWPHRHEMYVGMELLALPLIVPPIATLLFIRLTLFRRAMSLKEWILSLLFSTVGLLLIGYALSMLINFFRYA